MTFIADSRRPGPMGGYWPLQHENFDQQGYSVDTRVSRLAVRITGRLTAPGGQLGHYIYDKKSVGDILGGMLWPKDTRPTPAWAWGFGAVVSEPEKMLPIRLDDYKKAPRFEPLEFTRPDEPEECVQKVPVGTIGIAHIGTEEKTQKDLFFPAGLHPLIAVNFAGEDEYGSVVADLNDDNEIDPDRCARLQRMMRVVRPSSFLCGNVDVGNSIAWN